jgi:hypothetical protein
VGRLGREPSSFCVAAAFVVFFLFLASFLAAFCGGHLRFGSRLLPHSPHLCRHMEETKIVVARMDASSENDVASPTAATSFWIDHFSDIFIYIYIYIYNIINNNNNK